MIDISIDLLKLAKEKEEEKAKKKKKNKKSEVNNYNEPKLLKKSLESIKKQHELDKNKEDLTDRKKDRELKEKYAKWLYGLLVGEVIAIFLIVILDGFSVGCFEINEWLLGAIFNGIIIQSFFLVRLVTKHFFK